MKLLSHSWLGEACSLFAGILLTLAFAPFEIYPLAILSPALLVAMWLKISPQRAFWRGFLFGIGFFGTGVNWIFISVHNYGNASMGLAGSITFAFILILSLFPALNGYLVNRFFTQPNRGKIICAFPTIWVLLEWLRGWVFSGFPWLFVGYSQIDSPLKGYAPLFSVYGVSLAVLLSSALLVNAILSYLHKRVKEAYLDLFALTFIWIIGTLLTFINWTVPDGKPIQVSLIQGNIPQEIKWNAEHAQATLNLYQKLTEQHWDSKIIIWPEAAIPLSLQDAADYLTTLANKAIAHHTAIITGIPIKANDQDYYNAVISLGQGSGLYIKQHLVPFGEFTPLKPLFGKLLDFFEIPMSDMISINNQAGPFIVNDIKIASFICYEIGFPEQVLMNNYASGILLTVNNDAWFGHSIALSQHLEMARMRAVELGRPILFVSNTGITAFITPSGKIQSAAPIDVEYALTDFVQPMKGRTPWQRFHMDPILLMLAATLFFGWVRSARRSCYS
jgi:apolipoprotein N-acyltransferase